MLRQKNDEAYLACRLAAPSQQAQLMAVFVFFYDLYEASEASEAMVGKIKLAWWRERIEEIIAGTTPRPHPALLALGHDFSHYAEILLVIDSFEKFLDGWKPKNFAEVEEFIRQTFGTIFAICGNIYGATNAEQLGFAYGNLYLLRKFRKNKNMFLVDNAVAGIAEEGFAKNLQLSSGQESSAFGIIISHYQKHQNAKRWQLLLKLFLRAKSAF